MSRDFGFSLDELRVDAEEVHPPIIFPLSILVCRTEFIETISNVEDLASRIKERMLDEYGFKKPERRKFKEGFLEFREQSDCLECFFARETPTKVGFEAGDLHIHEERLRLINPSFSVKVKIGLDKEGADVILFGGSDPIMSRALNLVNYSIRYCVPGGHRTLTPGFSKHDMNAILRNFGLNVEYIWIHPGESEKFMKIVEKRIAGEVKRIPQYIVHAKLSGYHITGSPITISLVEESGIFLREIQGRFEIGVKKSITARVSSTGKILFFIPEDLVGKKQTVFDVAEELHKRLITQRTGPKQTTIGEYFVEES